MYRKREIAVEISLGSLGLGLLFAAIMGGIIYGSKIHAQPLENPASVNMTWAWNASKYYYLTIESYDGIEATGACASGYHMASLWEIVDVSNLVYDTSRGLTWDDTGEGPPVAYSGWIRTGHGSSVSGAPGEVNCQTWTSDSQDDYGTDAWLPSDWTTGTDIGPWKVGKIQCSFSARVWCVQSPFYVYLPLVIKG